MVSSISSIRFAFEQAVSVCAAFVAFYRVKYSSAVIIGPWGRPRLAVYLISACIILPCACVVFAVL